MSLNLDWQIGSKRPPLICLCCGTKFDDEKFKRRGPYLSGPYIWVCQRCWKIDYLYFSDKIHYKKNNIPQTEENPRITETKKYESGNKASLNSKIVNSTQIDVHINKLKLDPKNVRFGHIADEIEDKKIQEFIWSEHATKTLFKEIQHSQGIYDALIVDSKFVVREGNRRLVCLRKLVEEIRHGKSNIPLFKIEEIPCSFILEGTSEKEIAEYLTLQHVTGKKEWRALNQAKQIYMLKNKHNLPFEEMSKMFGKNRPYLENVESAYKGTVEYHKIYPEDENWLSKYSFFLELFNNKERRSWVHDKKDGQKNMRDFMKWIDNGKIQKGTDVRKLIDIIQDKPGNPLMNNNEASTQELLKSTRKYRSTLRPYINKKKKSDSAILKEFKYLQSDIIEFLNIYKKEIIDNQSK